MDFPRNLYIENAQKEGHSKRFITDTLNYIDHLLDHGLPVVFSLMHLSILLNVEYPILKKLIANRDFYYSYYLIKKKKGGFRRIIAPYRNIKILQIWIKENILDKVEVNKKATGFIKHRSILMNAKFHENNSIILNLDLANFFESIPEKRVYGIFKSLGYSSNLAVDFAKICTTKISEYTFDNLSDAEKVHFEDLRNLKEPFLVQGAPSSPGLSNLVCRKLDLRLSKLANKLGANYSRYVDDITFSGSEINLPNFDILKKIIEDEGFKINWNKGGRYKRGQKQLVTGLLIDRKVRITKKFKKEIYRHLYFCKKYGAYSHFQRISPDKGYKKEWLLGKIYYVHSIEPDEAKKMLEIVKQINWEI